MTANEHKPSVVQSASQAINPDFIVGPEVSARRNTNRLLSFEQKLQGIDSAVEQVGRVVKAYGTSVYVSGISASIGQRCTITDRESGNIVYGDVVGLDNKQVILNLLGGLDGLSNRSQVRLSSRAKEIAFSESLTGCIVDGAGRVIYQPHELTDTIQVSIDRAAPNPLTRAPIKNILCTGIKSIDGLLSVGEGQRLGIFAAAGVGKSTLLSMLAKHADADVIVIGLIGERGREVNEFIEHNLGAQGLAKSVLVVSTSDRPALERVSAAKTATTIAEGFSARGKRVLLLIDSITRYARALREIGLSVGEPPSRRGYPPSVFAELPRLLERAGNDDTGSITAFYTVLEEDEDTSDPVSEEVKSILDGHIELSRKIAEKGHYPPIDTLTSASRVFHTIANDSHTRAAIAFRQQMSKYQDIEILLAMGEYQPGSDKL
ncbi:MAG: FliI/YscN family ATPase, partial [Pseudomonadota bacterium]